VIAVHTTCLSETIGDDLPQIFDKAIGNPARCLRASPVGYANTPSYVGSHVTGFSNMVKAMAKGWPSPRARRTAGEHHPRLGRAFGHGRDQAAGQLMVP
jgi:nitrogenase molybdenum-iron protein alpha/beta subunit